MASPTDDTTTETNLKKVRHAGPVYVRGKIRRVWRPRYLELDDDGILYYYEASSTSKITHKSTDSKSDSINETHSNINSLDNKLIERTERAMQMFSLPPLTKTGTVKTKLPRCHSNPDLSKTYSSGLKGNENRNRTIGNSVEVFNDTLDQKPYETKVAGTISDLSLSSGEQNETGIVVTHERHIYPIYGTHYSADSDGKSSQNMKSSQSWDNISDNTSESTGFNEKHIDLISSNRRSDKENKNISYSSSMKDYDNTLQNQVPLPKQHDNYMHTLLSQKHRVHAHRPKFILSVLSARIIDATTNLKDLSIGVSSGSHGFLFRGRPISSHPCINTTNGIEKRLDNDNRIDRKMESNIRSDKSKFILSKNDKPYREYFCAVSTLEEAHTWVIALSWASRLANLKNKKYANDQMDDESICLNPNEIGRNDDRLDSVSGSISATSLETNKNNTLLDDFVLPEVDQSEDLIVKSLDRSGSFVCSEIVTRGSSASFVDNLPSIVNNQNNNRNDLIEDVSMQGVFVVAKVPKFHIIQNTQNRILGMQCEIFYEVKLLILGKNRLVSTSVKDRDKNKSSEKLVESCNSTPHLNLDDSNIEEWIIYRTYKDVILLIDQLILEHNSGEEQNKNLVEWLIINQSKLKNGPDITSLTNIVSFSRIVSFYHQICSSVCSINEILQFLSRHPLTCNSTFMRDFLFLANDKTVTKKVNLLQTDYIKSFISSKPYAVKKRTILTREKSIDDFIQAWLCDQSANEQESFSSTTHAYFLLYLQNPLIKGTLALVLVLFINQIYKSWMNYFIFVVTLRIDILLMLMALIFYAGMKIENSKGMKKQEAESTTNKVIEVTKSCPAFIKENKAKCVPPVPFKTSAKSIIEGNSREYCLRDKDEHNSLGGHIFSSPLPEFNINGEGCWSKPKDDIFLVRGITYLKDRVKVPSAPAQFPCRGVDVWLTDNPERHIARHPSIMGGRLLEDDTLLINFLLPFGNLVAYFSIPHVSEMPENVAKVWMKFIEGDQQYRDARLKLLPVVKEGPWIARKAVGPGTAPALLGKIIPLQYYFTHPHGKKKGMYEIDVIITASTIAKGILNVVKGHTKNLTIAFSFIIEAISEEELPEMVLCSFQLQSLNLERCPQLPQCDLDKCDHV